MENLTADLCISASVASYSTPGCTFHLR